MSQDTEAKIIVYNQQCLGKAGVLAHTTVISVLVKADKHANDFQMFFSKFQESRKTGGRTGQVKLKKLTQRP